MKIAAAALGPLLFPIACLAFQDWFANPSFDWLEINREREQCFNAQIQQQHAQFRGRVLSFASPIPSDHTNRFSHIKYIFCVEDDLRPGYCGKSYTLILRTSDPFGWEMDWERSTSQSFYVKAKDLARHVDIRNNESAYVGTLDILRCRGYFGVETQEPRAY